MRGGELQDVEVRGMNGRRTAVFRIDGSEEAKREYYGGKTVVNLQHLKLELKRLKDRAFDAIREEERYAAGYERGDRAHQDHERRQRFFHLSEKRISVFPEVLGRRRRRRPFLETRSSFASLIPAGNVTARTESPADVIFP